MSSDGAQLEQQVKFYLNQQAAELLVLRMILQVLIWNIVRQEPLGAGVLEHLRLDVMASLEKTLAVPPSLHGNQEALLIRQLTLKRAETIFGEIAQNLSAAPPTSPQPPTTPQQPA